MKSLRRLTTLAVAAAVWVIADPADAQTSNAGSTILVVEPRIRLSRMLVVGDAEARPDWSEVARANIARHARNAVLSGGRQALPLERAALSPQAQQILILHDAVQASIRTARGDDPPPATLSRERYWTLGSGARALGADGEATHALIITGGGEITGTLRALYVVGSAAAGVPAQTGLQRASASLVDLETGDIVWSNTVVARPDEDMRDPDGAHRLVTSLLKGAPL